MQASPSAATPQPPLAHSSTAAVHAAQGPVDTPVSVQGWRRHYMLLVLLFVYAMSMIDRQIMGVLIQPIKEEMGVSDTAMGLLTGLAFALFYSILAVPFGRYADRSNRRNLVAWCCMGWSVATGLCGMAVGYWSLAAARVAVAVGEAGGTAPSVSMIADTYPPRQRSRAMSIFMLAPHLGILFGLGLGAWIAQHYGWRSAFLWMALPGVVAALLLRFTCAEPLRGAQEKAVAVAQQASSAAGAAAERFGDVMRSLRQNRAFVTITLGASLMAFAGYAVGMWTTAFLVRSHGLQLKDAGALMGLVGGVSAISGAIFSGWLTDYMARRHSGWQLGVPALGTLLAVPFGCMFYMAESGAFWQLGSMQVPHSMLYFLGFSVCSTFWAAPAYAALTNVLAAKRLATALAVYNLMLTAVGGGLGPFAVGVISDALTPRYGTESLRWALVCMLVFYVLAALVFTIAIKSYVRHMRAAEVAP